MVAFAQIRRILFLTPAERSLRRQRRQAFGEGWSADPDSSCPYREPGVAETWWDGHEAYAASVQAHILLPGRYGKRLSVLATGNVSVQFCPAKDGAQGHEQ